MNIPIEHPKRRRARTPRVLWPELAFYIPTSAMTLAGFREWVTSDAGPEKGRFSFFGSEIFVDMTGDNIDFHNLVKGEFTRVLMNLAIERDLGKVFSDRAQWSNVPADVSNQPDVSFASYESFEAGRVRAVPAATGRGSRELEGTPDMVLEILSDSSERKDLDLLMTAYHKAGVPEYWLVDARGDEVDFRILARRAGGYEPVKAGRGGWRTSNVFGRKFRLEQRLDRVGMWQYALHVRR